MTHPGYEVIPQNAIAGLIIVHGLAEYGDRYRHAAAALADRGIACFVYDQRGHGEFPGVRVHVSDFSVLATDLESIGQGIVARFPSLPLFVWGHSMGSVVVTLAAIDSLAWARGIITTGSALDAMHKLGGVSGAFLKVAAALAPRVRIGLSIDGTKLTHVVQTQREHQTDPRVSSTASLRFLYGFALACQKCHSKLADIHTPWLAIHGGADPVCPVSGSEVLIASLGSRHKQLVLYPDLLHEVHNEDPVSQAALFALIASWIDERRHSVS